MLPSPRTPPHASCAAQLAYGEAQALDRVMYEEEVRREALSFEQQFHYGAAFLHHGGVNTQAERRAVHASAAARMQGCCVSTGGGCSALWLQGAMHSGSLFWPCFNSSSG